MNTQENQQLTAEIETLKQSVAKDPDDLVAKISLASTLEQAGDLSTAASLYQEIIDLDTEGIFAASAAIALEDLKNKTELKEQLDPETKASEKSAEITPIKLPLKLPKISNIFQSTNNLSIGTKQFIALFTTSLISIIGVVVAGMVISTISGRTQLRNQAAAELAVTVINYTSKINEMGTGFRGQADNIAIINAARAYQNSKAISPELENSVKTILKNELQSRRIEYASLIGLDSRIIVNANKDRKGEIFNPNNLVENVLKSPRRLQTNVIFDWAEIAAESPWLPPNIKNKDLLLRTVLTPVIDPNNKKVIGLLFAGDIVNTKTPEIEATTENIGGGYMAVYSKEPDSEQFNLVSSVLVNIPKVLAENPEVKTDIPLPDGSLLKEAALGVGGNLIQRLKIDDQWFTVAVTSQQDFEGKRVVFLVRGTPETSLNAVLDDSLWLEIIVGVIILIITSLFAIFLGKALTHPIKKLQETARKFGAGDRTIKAEVISNDEVGELAKTFNEMANSIEAYTQEVEAQSLQKEEEARFQRHEKESLQERVINLLLEIEGASQGDLTVRAKVDAGAIGSIADAFNATLSNLQELVKQVQITANEVHDSSLANGEMVTKLAQNATTQEQLIQSASDSVEEIAESIQSVSKSTQAVAEISHQSRQEAEIGQTTMDQTVDSIDNIRASVATTAKKAKRLAESSQEVSKIVSIIADISEKTNLLAFNASIEAARAGNQGQGFRIVADEVRRLAEQVTVSAQEIEQLISSIQSETAEMMQMMETSTNQVVVGTQLVYKTKDTLQQLAAISEDIDNLLASISESTTAQYSASQKVTENMYAVEEVAKKTAVESQSVSQSLQNLVAIAKALEKSASRFQVESKSSVNNPSQS